MSKMPMSPHQIFGRLQELKQWQLTHEKFLRNSSFENELSNEEPAERNSKSPCVNKNVDEEDYINVPLNRSFEQLLEEKLNECTENSIPSESRGIKPKQPFLRKGSGLLKYNLKPDEYKCLIGNKYSNTLPFRRPKTVQYPKKISEVFEARPQSARLSVVTKNPQNSVRRHKSMSGRTQTNGSNFSDYPKKNDYPVYKEETQKSRCNPNLKPKLTQMTSGVVKSNTENGSEKGKLNNNFIKTASTIPQKPEVIGDGSIKQNAPKLHDFIENISLKNRAEFSPLKIPEISMKPRGNWCNALDNKSQNDSAMLRNTFHDNLGKTDLNDNYAQVLVHSEVHSQWKNGFIKQSKGVRVGEVNMTPDCTDIDFPRSPTGVKRSLSYTAAEHSLFEKALETELLIFEALEKRAEQSGFSSTNTSIIQLLASTPSKFNLRSTGGSTGATAFNRIDLDEDIDKQPVRDQRVTEKSQNENVDTEDDLDDSEYESFKSWRKKQEFQPVDQQYDEGNEEIEDGEESDGNKEPDEKNEEQQTSMEELVDQRNVSMNTVGSDVFVINGSSSDVSRANSVTSGEVFIPPSSPQSSQKQDETPEGCASCGFLLKSKIEECQSELDILKEEKNRIVAIREQMAKDKKEFEKEMKTRRRHFEEQRLKFELELEEERKKLLEKQTQDKSSKDVKWKAQRKKEREELNNMKMELNETKELMKLRETKNAMSIARLRNQVKQLEKSNMELKLENEKLTKEKAKLAVQQKTINRSTENKMLKEIKKNISKLTEETFKNQCFKMDTSSEDDLKKNQGNGSSKGDWDGRKSLNNSRGSNKSSTKLCNGYGEGSVRVDCEQNLGDDKNIEEKYKSLFGGQGAIIEENLNNCYTNQVPNSRPPSLGKTERILDDGTKEIKYTNGNTKLISPNGTIRYYYSSNDTWHTNFPDGTEVLEFPNGQSEKRFKDGKCLVFFPDGLIQTIFPDGTEEVKYPDGSKLLTKSDGDRMLFLSNGQVEVHTKDQKRREYPDGTVKILYPDGTQETKYSNGRVRIKNSQGDIILDTGETGE